MNIKDWLNKGRRLDAEVNELEYARNRALDLACYTSPNLREEKIQSSKKNATERKFIAYADYADLINNKIDELVNHRREMIEVIAKIDNSTYRAVLTAYYINGKSWENIACELNYSIRQVLRMHGNALQKLRTL